MKRWNYKLASALAVALFLSVLSFAGCSSNGNPRLDPDDPVKIVIWHYYNGAQSIAFDNLVREFNTTVGAKDGIIVEAVSKSSVDDLIDAVTASAEKKAGADELPNIFQCYLDTAVSLDEMGVLSNLDQYLTENEKSAYMDSYIAEGTFGADNGLKLFPIAKSTELLVVNETAFSPFSEASGISADDLSTWEGIADAAAAYYEYSGGQSFFGRDAFANYMIIGSMQLGEEIFQVQDGSVSVNLNRDVMKKLWDNFYIPYIKGFYRHTGRFRTDDIKIGSIIAAVGSNPGMSYLPAEITDETGASAPVNFQILPAPNFKGTKPYAVQQGASMAVAKTSALEEYASVEFLKWFTSEETNIAFSISSGYLPVLKSSNSMDTIDTCLEKNGMSLTSLEHDVLETAIDEINHSTLYTSDGFAEGQDARKLLDTSMENLAAADRAAIEQELSSGRPAESVYAPYLSEDHFNEWYQSLSEQMTDLCRE